MFHFTFTAGILLIFLIDYREYANVLLFFPYQNCCSLSYVLMFTMINIVFIVVNFDSLLLLFINAHDAIANIT